MNNKPGKTFLMLVATGSILCAALSQAEIYKTVDENGNVIYTDQPPGPEARPMELPGLSIIETVRAMPGKRSSENDDEAEQQEQNALIRGLRSNFRDFAIISPTPEQTFTGTGNSVTVAWKTRFQLQPDMVVVIYLDGNDGIPTRQSSITMPQLDRGAHTVYAELFGSGNRKIATTATVTFHVRQYSVNFGANQSRGG